MLPGLFRSIRMALIVIDTNVFVAGLRSAGGAAREVLRRTLQDDAGRMPGAFAMSELTIRLTDDTAERLEALARSRGLSVNGPIEEMSVQALAAWDAERRFRSMAAEGDTTQALPILERLDPRSAE